MNKIYAILGLALLCSMSFVMAGRTSDSYKGLTPCELSIRNYHYGLNFFKPIRIPNEYCEEGAIKPRGISQFKWDFWHNHIYK